MSLAPSVYGRQAWKILTMSNRCLWNVRQRHEWLRTPLKGKHLKRRKRMRIGLEQALQRKLGPAASDAEGASAPAESAQAQTAE
ncbi:MAG TPA: hypothetical protein VGJ84_06815 [Polyangiaceae bacterium]